MGAGRRTQTFTLKERTLSSSSSTPGNSSVSARNLRKSDLGGVIFGCTHSTIQECMSNLLFGLPALHFSYVKNINPDLPLFLFNYSDRKLHGIFEAASPGQMNINPYGWSEVGCERTWYPAQVRVRIRMHCKPLLEDHFRPIINSNYHTDNHFWFELDRGQTSKLISLFSSSPVTANISAPRNVPKRSTTFRALPMPDADMAHNHQSNRVCSSAPTLNAERQWPPASGTAITVAQNMVKWSSLFKAAPKCESKKTSEDLGHPPAVEVFSHSDKSSKEFCPSNVSVAPCLHAESQPSLASKENYAHSDSYDTKWEPSGVAPCLDRESKPPPASDVDVLHSGWDDAEWDSDTKWEPSGVALCLDGESRPPPTSDVDVLHSGLDDAEWVSDAKWEPQGASHYFDDESRPPPALKVGISHSSGPDKMWDSSVVTPCLDEASWPPPASESSPVSVKNLAHSSQPHTELVSLAACPLAGESKLAKSSNVESDQSNIEGSSSGIIPCLDGKAQKFEAHLNVEGMDKREEEDEYLTLEEVAIKHECLKGHTKGTDTPFVSSGTQSIQGALTALAGKDEAISISSSALKSIVAKLLQRLEELKDFQLEQIHKTSSLQQKMATVARGDFGAELTVKELPFLQEEITGMCCDMGKAVILTANLLEGMIYHQTTRKAEVSDIATAVTKGQSGAVMFPVDTAN